MLDIGWGKEHWSGLCHLSSFALNTKLLEWRLWWFLSMLIWLDLIISAGQLFHCKPYERDAIFACGSLPANLPDITAQYNTHSFCLSAEQTFKLTLWVTVSCPQWIKHGAHWFTADNVCAQDVSQKQSYLASQILQQTNSKGIWLVAPDDLHTYSVHKVA